MAESANGGAPAPDLDAEREHVEQLARAHAALAAAQDRSYWLDRWGVDLNELMRSPAGDRMRVALRVARRGKRVAIEVKRRLAQEAREAGEELAGAGDVPVDDPLARTARPSPVASGPVTDLLYARLGDDGVAAVEAAVDDGERTQLRDAPELDRRRLLLGYGVHRKVPAVMERTGLSAATPPSDVHSMARGPMAAGGSTYYADLVAEALAAGGLEIAAGMTALDFGCSSGRVVRTFAAAHRDVTWHACDPNAEAIEWAAANLAGVEFAVSGLRPPLPLADGALDFAYAISIWSHFAAGAAADWLADMRRLVRPGGLLVLTTHGFQTIAHDHAHGIRSAEQLTEIRDALYAAGFWFKDEFAHGGDHGVVEAGWGTAFMTAEWLLTHAPGWKVAGFWPGRAEGNQDVYLLERR